MTDCPPSSMRPRPVELVGVAAIVFVIVMGTAHIDPAAGERSADAVAYVCGIAAAMSLLLWRRLPVVMVAIVATAIFVYLARSYPPGPALLPGPVSLVLLGVRAKRTVAWTGALVVWAAVTLGLAVGDGRGDRLALAAVGWTLAAVLAGQLISSRRERVLGERERRRLADRQAVTDERLRIAHDLHDSVAHAMATINVQSGTAAHLLATHPDRVDARQMETALVAIRTASAEVLDELGTILGVLRRDEGGALPLTPQVGLERVDELIERARADGLDLTADISPVPVIQRPVSEAGYRVIQESLSNVRRHAPPGSRVRVSVRHDAAGLTVDVSDDGAGAASPGAYGATAAVREGFGLIGMRERVESCGGSLTAGPDPHGGFRVVARWPAR